MLRHLVATAFLSTLAAVLPATATTTASAAQAAADPSAGAPVVGQCSDLSPAERDDPSHTEPPVDCASRHTAQVIAVVTLPDRLDLDSPGLEVFALRSCYAAQEQALGSSLRRIRLSLYDVAWFVPGTAQRADGARWVRCDLVLPSGSRLLPLAARPALGARPFAARVSRCLVLRTDPWVERTVACSKVHDYRVVASVPVRGERYRGLRGWSNLGSDVCPRPLRRRDTAWSWPTPTAWRAGDRSLLCFVGDPG